MPTRSPLRLLSPALGLGLFFAVAAVQAAPLAWEGTLTFGFGRLGSAGITGAGVATVTTSGAGSHLEALQLDGGITGEVLVPVTDPEVTITTPNLRVSAELGAGSFAPISGGAPLAANSLPIRGNARICQFFSGCSAAIDFPLTEGGGQTGVGVGGLVFVLTGSAFTRVSVDAAPWTLGTANLVSESAEGGTSSFSARGFVHGPESGTSSTAQPGGVVQLVTPSQVTTGVLATTTDRAMFSTLTVRFVPEPDALLILGSGLIAVAALGRLRLGRRGTGRRRARRPRTR